MKNRNSVAFSLLSAFVLLSFLITGCKKGDESLGKGILPGSSIIYTRSYNETGNIQSYTFLDEKIRVDHPGLNFVGSFNDPLFGRTDGSLAAQFRLSAYPGYGATASLDSMILRLTYKHIYGDTATMQTLKIYELTGDLSPDVKYLSSFNLKSIVAPASIGSISFIPKFKTDSAQRDTTTQYIRIRLDPSFGNKLLRMDSLKMTSNDEFLKHFKGLYVESAAANRKGTLMGLIPTGSSIGVYYHTAKKDSLFFTYNVTSNSATVAAFTHNYQRSRFSTRLNQEVVQDTLTYLQPMGGTKVKINVPSLDKWKDSTQYVINKASLTFYVDTLISDPRRYELPSRIYLKFVDSSGTEMFPKDSQLSSSYYGGIYNSKTASYTFNITRHLEQIMKKEVTSTSFYLVPSDRTGSANRVVLKGGNSSRPIELLVKYTRYQ